MWHPRRWVFVVFAAALAAPAWAAELPVPPEEQMAPGALKRFKELDRKLIDIERGGRNAARRISDLEDELRKARTKIARLEAKIATLTLTIGGLRADIRGLAGSHPTKPTDDTSTKPPTAAAEPLARIISQHRRVAGNDVIITGVVQNTSKRPLTFIVVRATFYDRDDKVVSTKAAYTNPRIIAPEAKATFKVLTRYSPRIHRHTLTTRTQ